MITTGDRPHARPAPRLRLLPSTPGSGAPGLTKSVLTTDSDRARPLSGGFLIQRPEVLRRCVRRGKP
eukprot:2063351-Pleurochrysis_carterae.AAC.1